VTLKLQQAFMAFVAEKQATPAFAAWKKAKADAKAKAKDAKKVRERVRKLACSLAG
jgi:hypothetical protein